MDVEAWAKEKARPRNILHPAILDELQIIAENDSMAKSTISAHLPVFVRPQTLIPIEKAVIRDADGLVELPDGKICYEGNWWLPYLKSNLSYKKQFEWRHRNLPGNYYSLLCLWSSTYFHWFHDVLPRLYTALPYLPEDTRFLINEKPKEFQILTLKALGITEDRLEPQPARMHSRIERLWFATPLGHAGLTSPAILKKVVQQIRAFFLPNVSRFSINKLWVSRAKAISRRIQNEDELESIFKDFGVEKIFAEDLSFLQQLELFANAGMVIGPHGAGLTNSFFCEEKTKVCEIAIDGVPPCYLVACKGLNLDFARLSASSVGSDHNSDMFLGKNQLVEYLSNK